MRNGSVRATNHTDSGFSSNPRQIDDHLIGQDRAARSQISMSRSDCGPHCTFFLLAETGMLVSAAGLASSLILAMAEAVRCRIMSRSRSSISCKEGASNEEEHLVGPRSDIDFVGRSGESAGATARMLTTPGVWPSPSGTISGCRSLLCYTWSRQDRRQHHAWGALKLYASFSQSAWTP